MQVSQWVSLQRDEMLPIEFVAASKYGKYTLSGILVWTNNTGRYLDRVNRKEEA